MAARLATSRPTRAQGIAGLALAVAVLGGCGGLRRAALRDEPRSVAASAAVPYGPPEPTPEQAAAAREQRRTFTGRVHAQVARRMRDHPAAVHQKVAGVVLEESTRANLDPLLVLAVIHVESGFDPGAESAGGAVGLMQVRIPTLREELGRPRAQRTDAFDPVMNVRGGVRYLRRMLDAFGATDLALMAYNAGPNRLRELLASGSIPARIRSYPRKVMREIDRLRIALAPPRRPPPTALAHVGPGSGSPTGTPIAAAPVR